MKLALKCLIVFGGLLCVVERPVMAQLKAQQPTATGRDEKVQALPDSGEENNAVAASSPKSNSSKSNSVSIIDHLQLSNGQVTRLDRLFDAYAPRRSKQEEELAQLNGALADAQSPISFDERKASRLLKDIHSAQENIAKEFLKTRGKALEVLTPVQRALLQNLATDTRLAWDEDKYSALLMAPMEASPNDGVGGKDSLASQGEHNRKEHSRSKENRSLGNGRYDVYAGYGYGRPQYGVYGSYGQGPVGVYAGVGRGGPSVGVNIGGGFGGLFGGWLRPR